MNSTNIVPSAVTDAVAHAPTSWQPWILAGISLFPFFTRFIYGLYSQRGIVGAVHGLLFGTNEVKEKVPTSIP